MVPAWYRSAHVAVNVIEAHCCCIEATPYSSNSPGPPEPPPRTTRTTPKTTPKVPLGVVLVVLVILGVVLVLLGVVLVILGGCFHKVLLIYSDTVLESY